MLKELVELGNKVQERRKEHNAIGSVQCDWDIVIDKEGNFIEIIPCNVILKTEYVVIKNAHVQLLLDKPEETLGYYSDDNDREESESKHAQYIQKLEEYKDVPELCPILKFYDKKEEVKKASVEFGKLIKVRKGKYMTFMVDMKRPLMSDNIQQAIIDKYNQRMSKYGHSTQLCSVCGTNEYPILEDSHGGIRMPDRKYDSMLVSYNKDAYRHYGMKGNINSGICVNCAKKYRIGFQYLVNEKVPYINSNGEKGERPKYYQKIMKDNYIFFWTKNNNDEIDPFDDVVQPTEEHIRKMFSSVNSANTSLIDIDLENRFYCFIETTIDSNISIRDWNDLSISEYRNNIKSWFNDIEGTDKEGNRYFPTMETLINSGLPKRNNNKNEPQLKAYIGMSLWKSAIMNKLIPDDILNQVMDNIIKYFAFNFNKTHSFKEILDKVCLIRLMINRNRKNKIKMVKDLDEQNNSVGYLCGRIFALMCKLQFVAQGNINCDLRQKYFYKVSKNPSFLLGVVIPEYLQVYVKKAGSRGNKLEKKISELCERLEMPLPRHLSMMESAYFVCGFCAQYHNHSKVEEN